MALGRSVFRTATRAGIAKMVLDELRKPENQQKLRDIGARVSAEVRKPENQEKVRRAASTLASKVRRRGPGRPQTDIVSPARR